MEAKVSHLTTLVLVLMLPYRTVAEAQTTQCTGLRQCMSNKEKYNEECGSWLGLMDCAISVCRMKQVGVSSQEIMSLSEEFCQQMLTVKGNCPAVSNCIMGSDIRNRIKMDQEHNDQPSIILESKTWCEYLKMTATCYLAYGFTCTGDDVMLFMTRQYNYLSAACSSASSGGEQVIAGHLIVILLWAVFIIWTLCSH